MGRTVTFELARNLDGSISLDPRRWQSDSSLRVAFHRASEMPRKTDRALDYWSMIVLHEEAARRANDLASVVVASLVPMERTLRAIFGMEPTGNAPDPTVHRVQEPLVGEERDRFGRIVGLSVIDADGALKLEGAEFEGFRKMLQILYRNPEVSGTVSEKTLSKIAFEWAYQRKWARVSIPMTEFVLGKLESLVRSVAVVIPIYGLEVEHALRIGRVEFFPLELEELNRWQERTVSAEPGRVVEPESAAMGFARLERYRGRTVARYETRAEAEHAVDCAIGEIEKSLAALRLFSPGALMPERPTSFTLAGREHVPKTEWIVHGTGDPGPWALQYGEAVLYREDVHPWVLDAEAITDVLPRFVTHWSDLLRRGASSEFEQKALRSLMLYSRATECRDTTEKLIHIFAAIESLLLKDDREPIGAALADRLAFIVGSDATQRLGIARNVREVYTMRSQFVHHGVLASAEEANMVRVEDFLRTVSRMFVALGSALPKHGTTREFLNELDLLKYG